MAAALSFKRLRFAGLSLLTIYSHGVAALSGVYGLALNRLRLKPWRKTVLLAALLAAPVLIVSVLYVGGAFRQWGGYGLTENPQEHLFWTDPAGFIPYYMGATILGLPFLFKRGKSEFKSLVTWGFVGSTVMLPIWADRWLHYVSIPLAVLAGLGIVSLKSGKWRTILMWVLIDIFIVYVASYFSFSLRLS